LSAAVSFRIPITLTQPHNNGKTLRSLCVRIVRQYCRSS
jgi:hypothetical protein